jgi:transposase
MEIAKISITQKENRMRVKTLLNRVQKYKSFVYTDVKQLMEEGRLILVVQIVPRLNNQPKCSRCGQPGPGYDSLKPRRFEFVPLWGIPFYFHYVMRRVACPRCGVVVESVPWAEGKGHLTTTYAWFLAKWAKRLSWKEVADAFKTTWEHVYRSVQMAVHWGLEHRDLSGITAIGVDEIQWQHGHKYLTVVYQINEGCKRLLWAGKGRTEETLKVFFSYFGEERSAALQFICSDMWKPYLNVIAEKAKGALNILDRYHIMAKISKAIDKVRAGEARKLREEGYEPVLKHSRWCLLKRPENRTEKEDTKIADLLRYNLKAVRSYLLKEEFQRFWEYFSPYWAGRFLEKWCTKVMRSRIEPMKEIARTLRSHRGLIMNWFKARNVISLGAVEGLNNKVKVVTRKSYGFEHAEVLEIALYHTLGKLPERDLTHRFC